VRAGALLGQEQHDAKARTDTGRAVHGHLAAHQVGEHLGDRQPEAGAAAVVGAVAAEAAAGGAARERLEDALHVALGDAGAGVLDLEVGHLALVADAQQH
jgi:hypothetical protein